MTAGRLGWLPRVRGPGLRWLPPVLRRRAYWSLVGRWALLGPLIGGLPYAWMILPIPFVYLFGLGPAALAGLWYGAWWLAPRTRRPALLERAAIGMICGAAGCACVALALQPDRPGEMFGWLALHGVPAALVLALWRRTRPDRPAAQPMVEAPTGWHLRMRTPRR